MTESTKIFSLTYQRNIPLMAVFELTYRCNLKCSHCYLPHTCTRKGTTNTNELSAKTAKSVLKKLAEAGCLYLVFTGGEIFLRKDIIELCEYARKLNFDLRLFTNATLINEKTAFLLSGLGLSSIEISLYGREKVHDRITQMPGSFKKTLRAIRLLKKNEIPVTIKCPIMKLNFSEYHWLIDMAKKLNINYHFDPTIAPKNNGDKSILKYRLDNAQLKTIFSQTELVGNSHHYPDGHRQPDVHTCSAGRNLVSISPDGTVYPCSQFLVPLGNLISQNFDEIWQGYKINQLRSIKMSDLVECSSCQSSLYCHRCPGLALLEEGNLYAPSKIACSIAEITKKNEQKNQTKTEEKALH